MFYLTYCCCINDIKGASPVLRTLQISAISFSCSIEKVGNSTYQLIVSDKYHEFHALPDWRKKFRLFCRTKHFWRILSNVIWLFSIKTIFYDKASKLWRLNTEECWNCYQILDQNVQKFSFFKTVIHPVFKTRLWYLKFRCKTSSFRRAKLQTYTERGCFSWSFYCSRWIFRTKPDFMNQLSLPADSDATWLLEKFLVKQQKLISKNLIKTGNFTYQLIVSP